MSEIQLVRRHEEFEEPEKSDREIHNEQLQELREKLQEAIQEASSPNQLDDIAEQVSELPPVHRHHLSEQIRAKRTEFSQNTVQAEVREVLEAADDEQVSELAQETPLSPEDDESRSVDDLLDENMPEKDDPEQLPPGTYHISKLLEGVEPIGHGSIATVYRLDLEGVGPVVIKKGRPGTETCRDHRGCFWRQNLNVLSSRRELRT